MDDAARLLPPNEACILENREVLHEARERHVVRVRELAHGMRAATEGRQHRAPRRVGQRAEHGVELRWLKVNHLVHFTTCRGGCQYTASALLLLGEKAVRRRGLELDDVAAAVMHQHDLLLLDLAREHRLRLGVEIGSLLFES